MAPACFGVRAANTSPLIVKNRENTMPVVLLFAGVQTGFRGDTVERLQCGEEPAIIVSGTESDPHSNRRGCKLGRMVASW